MIPRTTIGRGFKGAGAYYLQDKVHQLNKADFNRAATYALHDKGRTSAERVLFTHTLNLSTDDPYLSIREMCYLAEHANDLKRAAGIKLTGRKLEKPVYAFSLSWHPTEDPTKEQMISAGVSALKKLKMDHHQVLMVAHSDTDHPHIHMIVNRIDPRNGKAHPLSKDRLILSKWAEHYEKAHGKLFCLQREKNNIARENAQREKYQGLRKSAFVKDKSMSRKAWLQQKENPLAVKILSQAERDKERLDTPQAKEANLALARQKVLSGQTTMSYRPRGAKIVKGFEQTRKEVAKAELEIQIQQRVKIDREAREKIAALPSAPEWQNRLSTTLRPAEIAAWFSDVQFDGKEMSFPSRFKADYVKDHYYKQARQALGSFEITYTDVKQEIKPEIKHDPRSEWEMEIRNGLQDRQSDEYHALRSIHLRQRDRLEKEIEKTYGQHRRDEQAILNQEPPSGLFGKLKRKQFEQDRANAALGLADADWRIQNMRSGLEKQQEEAIESLKIRHEEERAEMEITIQRGPERVVQRGMERGHVREMQLDWRI